MFSLSQIHTLLGLGNITAEPSFTEQGVIGDGSSSPNDPIFINHHAMVDCMLEEWIDRYQAGKDDYPTSQRVKYGHRARDYTVPFIPLYQQRDMLVSADNFGYSCSIPESSVTSLHASLVLLAITLFVSLSF